MAAKSHHAQDNSVIERRLRPIYDWLESGNNKKALQESEKVIKKWPGIACGRALRCLAWLRLGREAEAHTQLEALAQHTPPEDTTLQVIAMCYRELHQLEKVCEVYERAVRLEPGNEEFHTHLFMSYVRVGQLDKQQHCAMQLYKLRPKNPYYFWAVMSVLLQATRGAGRTDPTTRQVLVSLCGRMVEKVGRGPDGVMGSLWGEQEVRLYLRVLSLQGRHQEALTLLASPHTQDTLVPGEATLATLPLLDLMQNWSELNVRVKQLLKENPDRWDFYRHYLNSSFHLMEGQPTSGNAADVTQEVDDTPHKCRDFLAAMMQQGGPKTRGPYLARLELFKRLREHHMHPEEVLGSAKDLLVGYLSLFGSKACSVSDLRQFLCLQPEEERDQLAQAFRDTLNHPTLSEEGRQRHISALQLCRMCGCPPSVEELVVPLRPPRAAAPAPSQYAPTDPYALLLAHHLLSQALTEQRSAPLLRALDVLHDTIHRSPSNFHCKLLTMKIYHIIGCGLSAEEMYTSLEVKHVQLDSLGHLHCALMGGTGLPHLALRQYYNTISFFSHSYKESVDPLTQAYKFGSFNKVEELMDWRDRLHNSLHRILCQVEQNMCEVVMYCDTPPKPFHTPLWDTLRDNRDLSVQVEWDPPRPDREAEVQRTFQRQLWYCRVKGGVARLVGERGGAQALREGLTELRDSAGRAQEHDLPSDRQDKTCMSRLHSLLEVVPLYVDLFESVLGVVEGKSGAMEEYCERLSVEQERVVGVLQEHASHPDRLWTYRDTLHTLLSYLELVSVSFVACETCVEMLGGKGKTKWRAPPRLHTLLQGMVNAVGAWPAPQPSLEQQMECISLSSMEFPPHNTWQCVEDHHIKMLVSIQTILRDKLKHLKSHH